MTAEADDLRLRERPSKSVVSRLPIAKDLRLRERPSKVVAPRWPLAYELAMLGTPVGVWIAALPGGAVWVALTVDTEGEVVELRRLPLPFLVRWCLNRHLRVHHTLGQLVDAITAGYELGWVHGRMVECKGARVWPVAVSWFEVALLGEVAELGALEVSEADLW